MTEKEPLQITALNRTWKHAVKNSSTITGFFIKSAEIGEKDFKIVHKPGPTSKFKAIGFEYCDFPRLPRAQILLDVVKDLTYLEIVDSKLSRISREDFQGLEALKELYIIHNAITVLPKGLFELTPNLEFISFRDNKIKEIDAEILEPLTNLKFFDLLGNSLINVKYDSQFGLGNISLAQLKKKFLELSPADSFDVKKEIEALKLEIAEIKKENCELKKEVDGLKVENVELKKSVDALKAENDDLVEELCNLGRENSDQEKDVNKLNKKINKLNSEFVKFKESLMVYDFTISVNGMDFQVNKEMIIANSPVLERLILGSHEADRLELKDLTEKTFEEILKFMQTKNPPNESENLIELLNASHFLEMKELMDSTAKVLMKKVTPDNALEIMNLCKKYELEELRMKAFKELRKSFPNVEEDQEED